MKDSAIPQNKKCFGKNSSNQMVVVALFQLCLWKCLPQSDIAAADLPAVNSFEDPGSAALFSSKWQKRLPLA